jgi:hypothetical protein
VSNQLSAEEYRLLSDQKAADFRSFLQLNPGLLAVTGAIFAAGLAERSTIAIVLSPLPVLMAVFQLVLNAELQLQLATYLAVFGPSEGGAWERDIAAVRPKYWKRRYARGRPAVLRPSAWNVWILFGFVLSEVLVAFPWMTGLPHGALAFCIASALNLAPTIWLMGTSSRVEKSRDVWTKLWKEHRDQSKV